jgi:hypothetical protein
MHGARDCPDLCVTTADELAHAVTIQLQTPVSRPLPTFDNEREVVKNASRYIISSRRRRSEVSINLYSFIVCITGAYHRLGTRRYIASQYTRPHEHLSERIRGAGCLTGLSNIYRSHVKNVDTLDASCRLTLAIGLLLKRCAVNGKTGSPMERHA